MVSVSEHEMMIHANIHHLVKITRQRDSQIEYKVLMVYRTGGCVDLFACGDAHDVTRMVSEQI